MKYILGILPEIGGISHDDLGEQLYFGVPDNETDFMIAHADALSAEERGKLWHQLFDVGENTDL